MSFGNGISGGVSSQVSPCSSLQSRDDDVLDMIEAAIPDPDLEIIRYDVYTRFLQLVLDPRPSDPQNGEAPCVRPNVPPYACKRPDNYVFWDGVHPTNAVHSIIANEVGMLLAE